MRNKICAVFDLDDTLFLERDYVRSGFDAVGIWAARWLRIPNFADRCWRAFLAGTRGSVFDLVLRDCGVAADTPLVDALVALYRTHVPCIQLLPDARDALHAIADFASTAVISDGPVASQSRKVEALGIDSFAAPIVLTEVMGADYRKPHTRAFEYLAQQFPGSVCVYLADNPVKDFSAPRALGWKTIRIRRPEGLHYLSENSFSVPDYELPDCHDVAGILRQM